MHRLTAAAVVVFAALVCAPALPVQAAATPSPTPTTSAECDPVRGCTVKVNPPPTPGTPGSGGSTPTPACRAGTQEVPCTSPAGAWSNSLQCYLQAVSPPPPTTDPIWGGHTDGAVYRCTPTDPAMTYVLWLPGAPPVAPTPEQLARQALATLHLPNPVAHRSPTEANSDHGTPYTWVNLWTWFWADPAVWRPLSARAESARVRAQVTVTPTRLIITPGDKGSDVACDGPGRPWTKADGDGAPTNGGCGYAYRYVTVTPITATVAIEWAVTWTGSGNTGGTLPTIRTEASSTFVVEQIQVVTR